MVKYGESYITASSTATATAKRSTVKTLGFDIISTAKLRALGYVNYSAVILDALNLDATVSISPDASKFRAVRQAEANLNGYTNLVLDTRNYVRTSSALTTTAQKELKEAFAQIWRIPNMGIPYIEGHDIQYEITEGYVYNEDMECYSEAKVLYTFHVPHLFEADLNTSVVYQNLDDTRIRYFSSNLDSQINVLARGVYNPGSFASLLFSLGILGSLGQRIRFIPVSITTQATTSIQLIQVNRKFNADIITLINNVTNGRRVRYFLSNLTTSITHQNLDDTRLRRTLVSLSTLATSDTSSNNSRVRRATINLQSTTTANIVGDFGGLTIEIDVITTAIPIRVYGTASLVDWGDGTTSITGVTKTYSTTGTKTISIKNCSIFQGINSLTGQAAISGYRVTSWGSNYSVSKGVNSLQQFIPGYDVNSPSRSMCTGVPNYLPIRDNTNPSGRFTLISLASTTADGAVPFNDSNITQWDLTKLPIVGTHVSTPVLQRVFYGCESFNQNISTWDTSNITDMSYWFYGAKAFNQNINSWNTSKVTTMERMFSAQSSSSLLAMVFNQPIGNWNTGLVTKFDNMFFNASLFNQSIGSWNTSSATSMISMFNRAAAFNQPLTRSGNSWNTANVTSMSSMFSNATSFDQNISNWCVSLIPSVPTGFDLNTPVTWTAAEKPVWGTCP